MPVIPKEVKWGEDNELSAVPTLTEEDKHLLEKKKAAFDAVLAAEQKAKYKIEVLFAHTRKVHGPSVGMLSIWQSGSKFHGGGDTKMYWCPASDLKKADCNGVIPDSSQGYGYLVCPSCGNTWKGEQVTGELLFKLDAWKWAEVLVKHYVRLQHNADIYLKYPRIDLRVASDKEQAKQLMGEELAKARSERQLYIYPLANIIKDTSSGSDLLNRFHALLTA